MRRTRKKAPKYTKTIAGAVVVLAAAVGLKFKLLSLTDAGAIAMSGVTLMGIGIRHGLEKALK